MKALISIIIYILSVEVVASGATVVITDYGAKPDDRFNDITAINDAIEAARAGDTVLLPEGTYIISSSISPKSDIKITGSTEGDTIIKYVYGSNGSIVSMSNLSNVEISHLTLDGDSQPNALQGITASSCSSLYLHHLTIRNFVDTDAFGPHGIYCSQNVTDSIISDNTFTNIAPESEWGAGIRLSGGSSQNKVTQNIISGTGRGGILCDNNSTDLVIINNTISNSGGVGLGIEVWGGCDRAIIEDNVVDHWISVDSSSGSAIRRNTVSDKSGIHKFTGLELVKSNNCIFTDNIVDHGAHLGISVSQGPVEYVYWAYNRIGYCSTWAVQLQGESEGATYHYFYGNSFHNTYKDHPQALYSNQGHGFRFNGNCHNITLDNNEIADNGRAGIQMTGAAGLDQLSFINNSITGNGGASITSDRGKDLEWVNNLVSENGNNIQLSSRGFSNRKPTASFNSADNVQTGQEINFINTSSDSDGTIEHVLWDFDDGVPSTQSEPTYTFSQPGTYRIALLVWDDSGKAAQAEKTITVEDNPDTDP